MKRVVRPTLPQQLEAFRLPDQIFAHLATGEIESIKGVPCFIDHTESSGTWYAIAPAMEGWLSLWRRLCRRYVLAIDLYPIEIIARRLDTGAPITPEEIDAARRVIDQCRKAYRGMDVYVVGSLVKTEQIAQQFERLGSATTQQPRPTHCARSQSPARRAAGLSRTGEHP